MLHGRMMDFPLTLTHFLERARTLFGATEIVSRGAGPLDPPHRPTTASTGAPRGSPNALARLGVRPGDRIATLAWNHARHLELYFAVPAYGAVLHTLNLRLHPSEIGYIANHAEDRFLFVDRSLLPLYEARGPDRAHVREGHRHRRGAPDAGAARSPATPSTTRRSSPPSPTPTPSPRSTSGRRR